MPASDLLGNPTTAAGGDLAAVDAFVGDLLGYRAAIGRVVAAADAAPACCLLNVYAGILFMLAETTRSPALARPWLERAQRAAPGAHPREQANVAFLRAWVDDDIDAALAASQGAVEAWPRDLVLVKLHQLLCFNRGWRASMLAIARRAAPAAADVAWLHGMLAFAHEELDDFDAAQAAAGEALRLDPAEPWAQHALAHVMLTQGRIAQGAAFLEAASAGWGALSSFMSTHLWWHRALFDLSLGAPADRLLAVYDTRVWGLEPTFAQDQVGAVSLLARLELTGIAVGDRWRDLGAWLADRADDAWEPFLAVQYLYGLARAGRAAEAGRLMTAIRARAADDGAGPWAEGAVPLGEALLAHAAGDMPAAIAAFARAAPKLPAIGGSHAQRDLFALIELDALIHAGDLETARRRLDARRRFDPDGVPLNRALAGVCRALGLDSEAALADDRVRRVLTEGPSPSRSPA